MTRQLLIDADFTLFMACAALERESIFTSESGAAVHILHSAQDWSCPVSPLRGSESLKPPYMHALLRSLAGLRRSGLEPPEARWSASELPGALVGNVVPTVSRSPQAPQAAMKFSAASSGSPSNLYATSGPPLPAL